MAVVTIPAPLRIADRELKAAAPSIDGEPAMMSKWPKSFLDDRGSLLDNGAGNGIVPAVGNGY